MRKLLLVTDKIVGGEHIAVERMVSALKSRSLFTTYGLIILNARTGSKKRLSFIKDTANYFIQARSLIKNALIKNSFEHILTSDYLWALAAISVKPRNTKIILSFHGLKSIPFRSFSDIDYRQIIIKFLERLSWMLSDVITVPSKEGSKYIYKNVGLLINKAKVFIVPNIVPNSFFTKINTKVKKDSYDILYSGRIGRNKGLENLMQAFSKLAIKMPKARLTIATPSLSLDKPTLTEINKISYSINDKQFRVLTDLTESKLVKLYSNSDVTVLPSAIEFAPLSVVESLAAGTPVMATKVGNIEKLLRKVDEKLILENNSVEEIYNKLYLYRTGSDYKKHLLEKKCVSVASKYSEKAAINRFRKVLSFLDNNSAPPR